MESLKRAIDSRNVIFVVGSGMSASSTNNVETATWVGLIRSGKRRAVELSLESSDAWSSLVDSTLQYGLDENDTDSLVRAAGMVKTALVKASPQAFADWLQNDVGQLQPTSTLTAKALLDFPFPVLTTNYDHLLESIGNRESATWKDVTAMQRVVSGLDNRIGHLHGIWSDPDSVVLSETDYALHAASESIQALQRAVSSIKSIIYVGFGSGLDDPNFLAMLRWHRETFPVSGNMHFRLCKEEEKSQLERIHSADNISPIVYGSQHSDLPDFLRSLMPDRSSLELTSAGIARDVILEAQQHIADELRADILIAAEAPADRATDELMLPPILLPVPHAEYVKARSAKAGEGRIDRLDPYTETQESEFLVIVADEGQGLTTTLRWLAWKAAVDLGGAAPLYVNFRQCRRGGKPLDEQVRTAARLAGISVTRGGPLPPYVLALDDLSPHVQKISDKVIEELSRTNPVLTIVGCRQGHEDELMERLRNVGLTPRLRYIGRIGAADIRSLAKIASPTRHRVIAETVIDLLGAENLPRTPFTASLLISVLVHNISLASTASQTAVLEQYVGLLLGRGDPHDDARFIIDQSGRETVLSNLAERFVVDEVEALPEGDVVQLFEELFERFGWAESATQLLEKFIDCRLLRRVFGQKIQFGRSSYLFLFAAKRAMANSTFLTSLMQKPLKYGPILMPYAALTRNDSELLKRVGSLIEDATSEALEKGSPYHQVPLELPVDHSADDDVETENHVAASSEPEESLDRSLEQDDRYLDLMDSERPLVLGDVDDDAPPIVRLVRVLELASTVLRDADRIEDLELKRRSLASVLEAWGSFISALSSDRTFLDFVSRMAEELIETDLDEAEQSNRRDFLDEFTKTFPATLTLGGISATLATRKLLVVLRSAIDEKEVFASEERLIATVFLVVAIKDTGWPAQLRRLLRDQGNPWIIRYFVLWLCSSDYINQAVAQVDEDDLLELCVEIVDRGTRYSTNEQRSVNLNFLRQDLRRARLQRSHRLNASNPDGVGSEDY